MTSPVDNLHSLMKEIDYLKVIIEDMECGGETYGYLADWNDETGIAQHAIWRGCQEIVKTCKKINNRLSMRYDHPIEEFFVEQEAIDHAQRFIKSCQERFQKENPCPKCLSHNTDIDLGTPIYCNDCGFEWLPNEIKS